jgi:hypothetical protein
MAASQEGLSSMELVKTNVISFFRTTNVLTFNCDSDILATICKKVIGGFPQSKHFFHEQVDY